MPPIEWLRRKYSYIILLLHSLQTVYAERKTIKLHLDYRFEYKEIDNDCVAAQESTTIASF